MKLETTECQKIVDRVIGILGKNINIMNPEGIIIASGDKKRVGSFHSASEVAAKEKREVVVDTENLHLYKGCREGVNIPIYYNNEVQGVVGITGKPEDIKGYGVIVKELVELMIQEAERRKFELFQLRAVNNFAKEIIKAQLDEDLGVLRSRAVLVGFEENVRRVVIAADICGFSKIIKGYQQEAEIHVQRLKQEVIDSIFSLCNPRLDVIFNLSEDRFVIFKCLNGSVKSFCEEVENLLFKRFSLKLYMGIGGRCKGLEDYHNAFVLANRVVDIGRKLKPELLIYPSEEYNFELLLSSINRENRMDFLRNVSEVFTGDKDGNIGEILDTIKVYFEHKMSVVETAKAMFVHRNTVSYRLNRFHDLFNIDVTDPYQCMKVYMAIMIEKLN